jgi:hypothetical protein
MGNRKTVSKAARTPAVLQAHHAQGTAIVNENLWDAKRCAEFLGYSVDYFRKHVRYEPGVPKPIARPGRERWLAADWHEWAENLRANYAKGAR